MTGFLSLINSFALWLGMCSEHCRGPYQPEDKDKVTLTLTCPTRFVAVSTDKISFGRESSHKMLQGYQ